MQAPCLNLFLHLPLRPQIDFLQTFQEYQASGVVDRIRVLMPVLLCIFEVFRIHQDLEQLTHNIAMSISGINISSYYNNSYKAGSVSDNEQLSGVQEAAVTQEETGAGLTAGGDNAQQQTPAPAHSDPREFTFDFANRSRFNLVAATSSMEDVDIKKAVSDMEKDSVLSQYKFFVGTAPQMQKVPNLGTDADGTVRLKMTE